MHDYSQPPFYQFNQDSILFARWLEKNVKNPLSSILDLGAGCGVIAFEIESFFRPQEIQLVEVQREFIPHIELNSQFKDIDQDKIKIHSCTFSDFLSDNQQKFDLIISNPPYYVPDANQVSVDSKRAHCRFFIQDNYSVLENICSQFLKDEGRAFILMKNAQKKLWLPQLKLRPKWHDLTSDVSILEYALNVE